MIRLLSVPHTGTRFMVEVLKNAGFNQTNTHWGNGDFVQVHFDGKKNNPKIYGKTGVVIIPLRARQEVEDSWRRRNRSLQELQQMWDEMCGFIQDNEDVHIIHIDDPNRRQDELHALNERLGTILIADFRIKVGQGK